MTFGIEFDVHHKRADGSCHARMTIHHGVLERVSLGFTVQEKHITKEKRVKGGADGDPMAKEKNLKIERMLNEAMRIHLNEQGLSALQVKQRITNKVGADLDFYAMARARVEMLKLKLAYNTREQRLSTLRVIERIRPHLSMADFTPRLLEEIELALLDEGKHKNTIASKLKRLSAMWCDLCKHHGLAIPNPWDQFEITTVESKVRGFFRPQVGLIEKVDLKMQSRRVQADRHFWLLMFYFAGMRPCDLTRLVETDIQGDELYYQMNKTDAVVRWGITPEARAIMDLYRGQGVPYRGSRTILPILRVQDTVDEDAVSKRVKVFSSWMGESMKVVAALCGLPPFSGYWARHSASTDALSKGVSNKGFQDMMGHKQSRNSDTYARRVRSSLSIETYKKVHG